MRGNEREKQKHCLFYSKLDPNLRFGIHNITETTEILLPKTQSCLMGSMLARKPITALIVSPSSFLPVIKVLSILCTVIFILNEVNFPRERQEYGIPAATLKVIKMPVAFPMWVIKLHTTINYCLKYNRSIIRTARMCIGRFSTVEVAIVSAEKDEKEKEKNQSRILYHQGSGQFNSLNDLKLVLLNVS